ncbi:MAG: flagellar assembly protein FliH [Micromonosporaceae bacterium]|nr:flagellar assembly protein FliH [Micromonosporaceae bacterium]
MTNSSLEKSFVRSFRPADDAPPAARPGNDAPPARPGNDAPPAGRPAGASSSFTPTYGTGAAASREGVAPAAAVAHIGALAPATALAFVGAPAPAGVTTPAQPQGHAQGQGHVQGHVQPTVTTARFNIDLSQPASLPGYIGDRLRAEAQAAGYATGWAQGRHEAGLAAQARSDQVDADVRQATTAQANRAGQAIMAVTAAAGGLERRMVPVATELEDIIVATAYALAEQIVGRELAVAVEPGRDAIARALAFAPTGRPVTIRLHPADYATVTPAQPGFVEIEGRTVTLLADATLRPGDAVAECDATTIDARIEPTLARVREVLGL